MQIELFRDRLWVTTFREVAAYMAEQGEFGTGYKEDIRKKLR